MGMNEGWQIVFATLEPTVAVGLIGVSFVASFINVALGIGGGSLLLAIMASLLPSTVLIPVHGVIQFGANMVRMIVLWRHVHWPPVIAFALGSGIGVLFGGALAVELPAAVIQMGVGFFVIYSVLATPPAWLSRNPVLTGGVSSFLTMFFGATGVFVANFTKSLRLERQTHVASHATFMTIQHGLKVLVFGVLGFGFGPWLGFVAAMTFSGFLGTLIGRMVLLRMGDNTFKRALDVVLFLISLRLIWSGLSATFWPG